jgi:hypothetical protein
MSKKRRENPLKLPHDFLGTLRILVNTPPPLKEAKPKRAKKRKAKR